MAMLKRQISLSEFLSKNTIDGDVKSRLDREILTLKARLNERILSC